MLGLLQGKGGKKRIWQIPLQNKIQGVVYHIEFSRGILNLRTVDTDSFLFYGEYQSEKNRPLFDEYATGETQYISIYQSKKEVSKEEKDDGKKSIKVNLKSLRIPTENVWNLKVNKRIFAEFNFTFAATLAELYFNALKIKSIEIESGASEVTLIFNQPNPISMERLEINSGASKIFCKKLGNANARLITFESGVGKNELDFSGDPRQDCEVRIKNGVGFVKLYIPRKIGAKFITESSFLSSFNIDDYVKKDNIYYSIGYEKAPIKYTFFVENSFGSIEVIWVK